MKLNKKGFTLIELLAVIAILAILIVIAVPAVLDLFQTSKQKAFVTQAQSLFKSAEQAVITEQINGKSIPTQFCYIYTAATDTYSSASAALDLEGTKKLSYNIKLTNGKVTEFAISNGDYSITIPTTTEINVSDIGDIDSPRVAVVDCN